MDGLDQKQLSFNVDVNRVEKIFVIVETGMLIWSD